MRKVWQWIRQDFTHKAAAVIVSALALLGTVWSTYQIIDGIREIYAHTFPEFNVTGSNRHDPFALPFSIKNPSTWFVMRDAVYDCDVAKVDGEITNSGYAIRAGVFKIDETKNFNCGVLVRKDTLHSAKVVVSLNYKTLWIQRARVEEEFNWVTDRWVKGALSSSSDIRSK
jgi:hypothetical protein